MAPHPAVDGPRYAVIVVTYHREEAVARTLAAIEAQSVGRAAMEICVVDNGGAPALRQRWQERVEAWVDPGENLGCSGGRNRGVAATRAPVLVFIDDDGIPAADFVEQIEAAFERHPDALAIRGRAVHLHHPLLTTMASTYDRGPRDGEDMLTLEGGSAVLREAYERVGGYDVSRAYHEGIELSGRMLEAMPGRRIYYTPDAVLRHDYLQGLGHLMHKARMLARADERLQSEDDPRLRQTLRQLHALPIQDGRPPLQRIVGKALHRGFRAVVDFYRMRARWGARLGLR